MSTLNNATQFTVVLTKARGAKNLTHRVTSTFNLTGTVTECKDYMHRGERLDSYVIDTTITLCMEPQLGQAVLDELEQVFAERAAEGNNALQVAITFKSKDVRVLSNILAYSITDVEIDDTYTGAEPVESIMDRLQANKQRVLESREQITAQKATVALRQLEDAASAVADSALVARVRNFVAPIRKGK